LRREFSCGVSLHKNINYFPPFFAVE